jgi:hypothetical protein
LTDVTANAYVASKTVKPSEANTAYSWLQVASNVIPPGVHRVRFQINTSGALSTDWYVDEAIMVPAGSGLP